MAEDELKNALTTDLGIQHPPAAAVDIGIQVLAPPPPANEEYGLDGAETGVPTAAGNQESGNEEPGHDGAETGVPTAAGKRKRAPPTAQKRKGLSREQSLEKVMAWTGATAGVRTVLLRPGGEAQTKAKMSKKLKTSTQEQLCTSARLLQSGVAARMDVRLRMYVCVEPGGKCEWLDWCDVKVTVATDNCLGISPQKSPRICALLRVCCCW